MSITENFKNIRESIPPEVRIVIAAKGRTDNEIAEVIAGGATDIGENYIQQALAHKNTLAKDHPHVMWHMIGPLQTNKINKALECVDCIQTVDSFEKAKAIHDRCARNGGKPCIVYVEINSAEESAKSGIAPEYNAIESVVREISALEYVRLEGLMTMGPLVDDPETMRPYFRQMHVFFDRLREQAIPGININTLSMGMSDSYKVAIEEGATMVRLGTCIFGPRGG